MGNSVIVTLEKELFSVDAVNLATYKLSGQMSVEVKVARSTFECELSPLDGAELESLKVQFLREVNDQELRIRIAHQTENERNLILAFAFSRTGLDGGSN